jgi:hypothetical protein
MIPRYICNKPSGRHHEGGQMLLLQPVCEKFDDFETKTKDISNVMVTITTPVISFLLQIKFSILLLFQV